MVNTRLKEHVKNALIPEQHGFVGGRSCITNLVEMTSFIASGLEQRDIKQVDVIYTDFTKAFDRVEVRVVMIALESFKISGSSLT
jgi:hypothetical protein